MSASSVVTKVLGLPPVAGAARTVFGRRLRILAHHGVPDRDAFAAQVAHVRAHYNPVGEEEVLSAFTGGAPLPRRAVWLTFDDGDPTVLTNGLPVLEEAGVPATLYVCPGLIESGSPPWWEIVQAAALDGRGATIGGVELAGHPLVVALKKVPDDERREVVASLDEIGRARLSRARDAITADALRTWVDAGLTVGNHTWDHPCLDHCSEDEQRRQIELAHRWVHEFTGRQPTFAYPNGDHSAFAESVLEELGYQVALLYDHALVEPGTSPLRLSRLRLDTDAPLPRARAIVSGGHSAAFGARR